jgi:2-polyprenyl-6-methoxyphenol hydroxylase-like FAD-dependent oxidoreductase
MCAYQGWLAISVNDTPIMIVGGGSVGLSLAAELGWRGVSCMLVERADGLNVHPRANAVANRTMEYYRRYGIDQAITDAGIPPDLPANYCYVTSSARTARSLTRSVRVLR